MQRGIRRAAERALLLLVLLGAAAMLPAPAAAASCSATGSTSLTQAGRLRIYRTADRIYGCSPRYGRRVLLESHATGLDRYARSGPLLLGYAIERNDGHLAAGVRNLNTGHLIHRRLHVVDSVGDFGAKRLLINVHASIAYIFATGGITHANGQEVWKQDTSGARRLDSASPLGTGTTIDIGYLQVVGPNVRWKVDGVVRNAPFH